MFCSRYKPKNYKKQDSDLCLSYLNDDLSEQNIELKLDDFKKYIINKNDLAFDLLAIAIYVYIADRRTYRGNLYSTFDPNWNQELEFYVPVSKPSFWKQRKIRELLEEMFHFAIGHSYKFNFVKDEVNSKQLFIEDIHQDQVEQLQCDCISLFSGGLDSLASTLDLLIENKKKPLLLAHETAGKLKTYRNNIFRELNQNFNELKKWELKIQSKRLEEEPKGKQESSQRSRSILYACLGLGFAKCLNIKEVYLSDNGIVTFNLPSTESNKSTQLTRSTNPKLIELINSLSTQMWKDKAPQLENLLLWKTKADVVQKIIDYGYKKLVSQTTSCVDTQFNSYEKPFCGECSQCFERRFAVELCSIDEIKKYKFDIFKDSLDRSMVAKTHYENFFRRADFFIENQKNLIAIYKQFPQISDYCASGGNEQEFLQRVTNLYIQHAQELQKVLGSKGNLIIDRNFASNSLLDIEYRKRLYIENREEYVSMNNNAEVVQSEKPFKLIVPSIPNVKRTRTMPFTLNIAKTNQTLFLKREIIPLSETNVNILYKLFLSPTNAISYSTLKYGKHDELNNDEASTAIAQNKKQINKNIQDTSKKVRYTLPPKFTSMDNQQGFGYRINKDFYHRTRPISSSGE
ncbi:MAG: hypothetical protein ACK481_08210 [Candidatus Melainabacteria bacterium]